MLCLDRFQWRYQSQGPPECDDLLSHAAPLLPLRPAALQDQPAELLLPHLRPAVQLGLGQPPVPGREPERERDAGPPPHWLQSGDEDSPGQ